MRRQAAPGEGLGEALAGAARMAGHLVTGPLLRRGRDTWGATTDETAAVLPGDELIPAPGWRSTRAITIDVPPEAVWPWLVQLGQGRGGFYSLTRLENLVGCRLHNATTIEPQWQQLAVGDPVRMHAKDPGNVTVAQLSPPTDLVLCAGPDPASPGMVWGFHVRPAGSRSSRLLERQSYAVPPGPAVARLAAGPYLVGPVSYVMSRAMLENLKLLIERSA